MRPAHPIYSWLALALMLSLSACQKDSHKHARKEIIRRISLWRKDNIPYGTKVAFDELSQIFPRSVIETNRDKPFAASTTEAKKAYIIIGMDMSPSPKDLNAMMNFVEEGNHVFISARFFNDTLLHTLGLGMGEGRWISENMDSMALSILDPEEDLYRHYSYPGDKFDTWFSKVDSQYAQVVGKDDSGRANMIRITYKSGGSICVQCAPLAFSNFFLLHKQNRDYYELALSYLPSSVGEVIWDDHFRYGDSDFSAFRYILGGDAKTRPLAWAFGLLCLLFLLLYSFNAKRRQRMIPRIEPLRNTSVDFVRTIGRLYFQRRDNQNLAMKMTAHFLDHVRTRWRMPTTELNASFAESLAYRSGYPREKLNDLLDRIYHLPLMTGMSDEELMDFHYQLEAFYKQA